MDLTREQQLDMHRRMVRIRLFEEAAGRLAESGQDARLPAPLRRPGGRRRRRVRGAARRRPDHLDPPRPRPPRRQGRRLPADDGRADGQGDRLLQAARAGRCTSTTSSLGMLGANGIVGAGVADRRRRRVRQQVPRHRPGRGGVLRRRRDQHRRLPRGGQHGVRAAPAGRVRLREQRVRRVHADATRRWRSPTSSTAPPATACPA